MNLVIKRKICFLKYNKIITATKRRVFNSPFFIYNFMIKKWKEFIKESKDNSPIWRLSEEDIKLYLVDMLDIRYEIILQKGRIDEDGEFTRYIKTGLINPGYKLLIGNEKVTSDDDVTDTLLTVFDYLETKQYEISAHTHIGNGYDSEEIEDISSIVIKNKIYADFAVAGFEEIDDIWFIIKQLDTQISLFKGEGRADENYLNQKGLADYYNWKIDEEVDDKIYTYVKIEDLSRMLLDSKSDYIDMLSDSIDMSDIYDNSDPDTSIIYSELNNENSKKLVIKMIDEFGGFDEFVSTEKQLKGLDESAVIDFILNERFGRILDRLSEDSETMMDIKNIYVDFENYGHYIKNRKEVLYSFQDIIGKELKYDILDKDGTDYYRIEFEDKWLIDEEDVEYQDYENLKLIDVLRNYCEVQDFNYDLKPNFSDYGEVDSKSFNAEVKSILK
jgi:hypothetical protein